MYYKLLPAMVVMLFCLQSACKKPSAYANINETIDSLIFEMPNAFTPNYDGYDDNYLPVFAFGSFRTDSPTIFVKAKFNPMKMYEMEIKNEENKTVFHSTNIEAGWNGYAFNKPAPIGKYNAYIHIEGRLKGTKNINIPFLLIR